VHYDNGLALTADQPISRPVHDREPECEEMQALKQTAVQQQP
jgi:hypothetical protein